MRSARALYVNFQARESLERFFRTKTTRQVLYIELRLVKRSPSLRCLPTYYPSMSHHHRLVLPTDGVCIRKIKRPQKDFDASSSPTPPHLTLIPPTRQPSAHQHPCPNVTASSHPHAQTPPPLPFSSFTKPHRPTPPEPDSPHPKH